MYKNCLIIDTEQTYGDVGYVVTQEARIVSFGQFIVENLFKQTEGTDGYKRKLKRYQEMVVEPENVTINELFSKINLIISKYDIDTIVCHSLAADKKVFASWALDRDVENPFVNPNIQLYDSTNIAKALLINSHKEYGLEYTIGHLYGDKIKQRHTGLDDASLTALLVVGAFYYQNRFSNPEAIKDMINRTKQLIYAYFTAKENLYLLVEQAIYYQDLEEKVVRNYELVTTSFIEKFKEMQSSLTACMEENVNSCMEQMKTTQNTFTNQIKIFQNKIVSIEDTIIEKQNALNKLNKDVERKQQELEAYNKEHNTNKTWRWLAPVFGIACGALTFILLFIL